MQDIIVYGVLALLFFLTVVLLGVDTGNSVNMDFIPPSTTQKHIAALVFVLFVIFLYEDKNTKHFLFLHIQILKTNYC